MTELRRNAAALDPLTPDQRAEYIARFGFPRSSPEQRSAAGGARAAAIRRRAKQAAAAAAAAESAE